jgi:hypothetical protein
MRSFGLQEFLALPKLTPGRRRKALERMRQAAVARGLASIVTAIDAAIRLEDHALALTVRWNGAAEDHAMHADGAQKLDAQLDRSLSGLYESLQLKFRAFDEPEVSQARALLEALFPKGPGAVTSLPYVDRNALVGSLLARMAEPAHRDALTALHLWDWVERIREINDQYGRALSRPERLTHEQVVAADRAGWAAMLSVVATVLGIYPDDTQADIEGRRALLQPLTDQQDEMSTLRARRRGEITLGEEELPEEPTPAEPHQEQLPPQPALTGPVEN